MERHIYMASVHRLLFRTNSCSMYATLHTRDYVYGPTIFFVLFRYTEWERYDTITHVNERYGSWSQTAEMLPEQSGKVSVRVFDMEKIGITYAFYILTINI